ncbi:MAG: hypothetical protein EOO38_21080 [Cytophagaceae bacterium]|nr:MAG: hypothetical protein EOO38_21080 [Cytophagaceae bacterium]
MNTTLVKSMLSCLSTLGRKEAFADEVHVSQQQTTDSFTRGIGRRAIPPGPIRYLSPAQRLQRAQFTNRCPAINYGDFMPAEMAKAICLRLAGDKGGESILRGYLNRPDTYRLALVNLAAFYAQPKNFDKEQVRYVFTSLKTHVVNNPNDRFARLAFALLFRAAFFLPESVRLLEELYLDFPDYTPCISALAATLGELGWRETCKDYAEEALRKDPDNAQAAALLEEQLCDRYSERHHAKLCCFFSVTVASDAHAVLHFPYEKVDLDLFYPFNPADRPSKAFSLWGFLLETTGRSPKSASCEEPSHKAD